MPYLLDAFSARAPYYRVNREERNLVALLYHLLLTGENLQSFLKALDPSLQGSLDHGAEVYFEYAFARDVWNRHTTNGKGRETNNETKRDYILSFFGETLQDLWEARLPHSSGNWLPAFNGLFGRTSARHVESPSNWRVSDLHRIFIHQARDTALFEAICKFKWCFNIKPDMVIQLGGRAVCIEAKLESNESTYPTSKADKKKWNGVFGNGMNRVGQIELQRFLFGSVLGIPRVDFFLLQKSSPTTPRAEVEVRIWAEIFSKLQVPEGFVARFLRENEPLGLPRTEEAGAHGG